MKSEVMTRFAARVAVSLQAVNLDSAMSFWVANSQADENPQMQNAMRELIQAEQLRRSGTEIVGYTMPAFEEWGAEAMLEAGAFIKGITETSAKCGDPGLIDFGFRMMDLWLCGLAAGLVEAGV